MSEMSERHEIRIRGRDHTTVFLADSNHGGLIIRQEPDGKDQTSACEVTLSDPAELRDFFEGLRKILSSLGHATDLAGATQPRVETSRNPASLLQRQDDEREAVVAQARQRNPQAFAPWSKEEEQEVIKRHQAGESVQAIARQHKRSPRAIELRLQRLGILPPETGETPPR